MQKKGSLTQSGPLLVGADRVTIHVAIASDDQMDMIYVYAFPLTDTADVIIDDDCSNVVTRRSVGLPCFGPILIANGVSRNRGITIRGRCEHGRVAVFGRYVRSTCQNSVAMHANVITNHLILAHETLSAGRTIRDIDASVPLTLVHADEEVESILRLGPSQIGTMKHVVLNRQCSSKAICRVIPCHATLPIDALKQTQREIVLAKEGDSVSLMWTGDAWICFGKSFDKSIT